VSVQDNGVIVLTNGDGDSGGMVIFGGKDGTRVSLSDSS